MKKKFEDHKFLKKSIVKIDRVNSIIDEYSGQSLTLRQLFYQLVARGFVENSKNEYDNLAPLSAMPATPA